jgi:hypothetical protein
MITGVRLLLNHSHKAEKTQKMVLQLSNEYIKHSVMAIMVFAEPRYNMCFKHMAQATSLCFCSPE